MSTRAAVAVSKKHRHEQAPVAAGERSCRACGCTDRDCSGCVKRTGKPCHWVEWDLCSACKKEEEDV
jgi:hypothetical protein